MMVCVLLQVFHEELTYQWNIVHPSTKGQVLQNAWFFFEMMVSLILYLLTDTSSNVCSILPQIKSMAQYLSRSNKLNASRRDRFSVKFMEDLEALVGSVAGEICHKHVKVGCVAMETIWHNVMFNSLER